jgi:citrate synthase
MGDKKTGGLAGVVAGRTAVSFVDPERSRLFYRGYDVEDLAQKAGYEETAFLLLRGELPGRGELAKFSRRLSNARRLPAAAVRAAAVAGAHPMDAFRTGVSALAAREDSRRNALALAEDLVAQAPLLAAGPRRGAPARGGSSHAGHFLALLTGRAPADEDVRAFDATLVLYAEHGFNASTFTARVAASTLCGLHGAVAAAAAALSGPLHGGANEKAMETLSKIGRPERARAWVEAALARKEKIMGFGHRVYKKGDSRHTLAKRLALELSRRKRRPLWVETAQAVEEVMKEKTGILPNVDLYASVVYRLLGIPVPYYTPIFAAARTAGWCAHILEQRADNKLIRPDAEYVGPSTRPFVPLDRRT